MGGKRKTPKSILSEHKTILLKSPGTIFYVNRDSSLKNEILDFLKWLALEENAAEFSKDALTISSIISARKNLNPKLQGILTQESKPIDPIKLTALEHKYIIEIMLNGVRKILQNEMTPEQLIQSLENARLAKNS